LQKAQPRSVRSGGLDYRAAARLNAAIAMVAALMLATGFAGRAAAEPLTVAPASTSWERFNPTLELPRVYNSDGSLPAGAEMPDSTALPDAAPDSGSPDASASAPAPDGAGPAASEAEPGGPTVTNGDPPLADGHHDGAGASGAAGSGNQSIENDGSLPEPDPETALGAPSTLDPTDGTDYGPQNATAGVDPNGNPVGDARDYQNEQIDAPSVVLIPPPYYGPPRQPMYGYPYYGPVVGAYSSFGRTPGAALPPPIPDNARFGAMPPPGYPWIGGSAMVPWSATHMPATSLHIEPSHLHLPPATFGLPSFPMH